MQSEIRFHLRRLRFAATDEQYLETVLRKCSRQLQGALQMAHAEQMLHVNKDSSLVWDRQLRESGSYAGLFTGFEVGAHHLGDIAVARQQSRDVHR